MRNLPLRSRKLTRLKVSVHSITQHYAQHHLPRTREKIRASSGTLINFLTLRFLWGEDVRPPTAGGQRDIANHETLFVQCEGTLFTDYHRQRLASATRPFKWDDYYRSIRRETLDIRHLPIIRAAADLGCKRVLLCSTPVAYKAEIEQKLEEYGIRTLFTEIVCKEHPREPTKQFLRRTVKVKNARSFTGYKYLISYTDRLKNNEMNPFVA